MMGVLRRFLTLLSHDVGSIDECDECGAYEPFGNRCPECVERNRQ